jgi:hypothetical protein
LGGDEAKNASTAKRLESLKKVTAIATGALHAIAVKGISTNITQMLANLDCRRGYLQLGKF